MCFWRRVAAAVLAGSVLMALLPPSPAEARHIYDMNFPLVGDGYYYYKSFGACRDKCRRRHTGVDIVAPKLTPVVAVADGTVRYVGEGEECCAVSVIHDDGWHSVYAHMNNDTPGTDDGELAGYAPGIVLGARVSAGTLLGWVGDSGNAENTAPHLHFELHKPSRSNPRGIPIDPWPHLRAARLLDAPLIDSTAACDFDGDGTLDVAVARPGAGGGEAPNAGEVVVMRGIAAGTYLEAGRLVGAAELDLFGAALGCAEINGDGYHDLVVGAPGVDQGRARHAGAAYVYWGSPAGLGLVPAQLGPPQAAEDRFGSTVVLTDLDGDGLADVVVGAPYTAARGSKNAGAVYVYRGTPEGLSPAEIVVNPISSARNHLIRLGTSLWVEDENGDGLLDVVVGGAGSEAGILEGSPVEVIRGTPPPNPPGGLG